MDERAQIKFRGQVKTCRKDVFEPQFYRLSSPEQAEALDLLLATTPDIRIFDEIESQITELLRIRNPSARPDQEETDTTLAAFRESGSDAYGVWVYYPWSASLVHLVDEEEFIELRTSRNKYKITEAEQHQLKSRKVGIIGLSVGQTIAITMTMERLYGEIRLADFDDLELSNLNRLRAGLHELGNPKVVIAAREIAEIDPFVKVVPYFEGITEGNINSFLTYKGKLDMLIEECDSLDIKIFSRIKAKEHGIPVIMDTNDRGMLDIERFDLEPERPIMHGLIDHLPLPGLSQLRNLTNAEKLPYLAPMVAIGQISDRLKASVPEIGKTITTWPQLASSVMLGGAMVADTCRRIFLGELLVSGRYYIDFDKLIH